MKVGSSVAVVFLAVASVEAFAIPPQHVATYALESRTYRNSPLRRQIEFVAQNRQTKAQEQEQKPERQTGGGLTIGGLALGGSTGGLSVGGLQLGGNRQGNNQQQEAGQQARNGTEAISDKAPAVEVKKPAAEAADLAALETEAPKAEAKEPVVSEAQQEPAEAGAGAGADTANQPGRAEGEAAREEALQEAQQEGQGEAAQQEKSNGVKATEESERFSEEIGITLDQAGNAQNLGGNLGITQGTDGSKSVGGENGINIAASGEAIVAGND